jgi:hypothetical protein
MNKLHRLYVPIAAAMIAAMLLFGLLQSAPPARAAQASVTLEPSVTLPNQDITLTGTNFPTDTTVRVYLTVDLRGGGNRTVSTSTVTDSNGDFAADLFVPYKVAPGRYAVVVRASGVRISNLLRVLPLSAHPFNLSFRWISLWYHTVRQGTWDYINIQGGLSTQLGIWVHVIFPNGIHYDYYQETDGNGHWAIRFNVPGHAVSSHSNQGYLTFQLWHGNSTTQGFMTFTLV